MYIASYAFKFRHKLTWKDRIYWKILKNDRKVNQDFECVDNLICFKIIYLWRLIVSEIFCPIQGHQWGLPCFCWTTLYNAELSRFLIYGHVNRWNICILYIFTCKNLFFYETVQCKIWWSDQNKKVVVHTLFQNWFILNDNNIFRTIT